MDEKLAKDLAAHRAKKEALLEKERSAHKRALLTRKGKDCQRYTDKQKISALHTYAATGSWVIASQEAGMLYNYLRNMGRTQWFKDSLAEIRREDDDVLDGDLSSIIKDGIAEIKDRVKNGDWMWDSKANKFVRKPLKATDAVKVTTALMDQRNVLRGKPTRITEQVSVNDRLQKLANEFENFQRGRTVAAPIAEVTDVDIIEEPFYGDEEELQIGVPELSGETGTDQESGRTE